MPFYSFFHFQLIVFYFWHFSYSKHKCPSYYIKFWYLLYIVFFCVLTVKNSVLVWFWLIWSAIASLDTLGVFCRNVNLDKSNTWSQNNDICSLTSLTYFIFLGTYNIASYKNCVYINILELAPIAFILKTNLSLECTKNFWNIIIELYAIISVVCQADSIFQKMESWHLVYYIKELKSVLLIL